jgi:hypothetical protein
MAVETIAYIRGRIGIASTEHLSTGLDRITTLLAKAKETK